MYDSEYKIKHINIGKIQMTTVIKICAIIGTVLSILMIHKAIFATVGVFKTRKFAPTLNKHKYAICIAGRNEEKVIENLLESIRNQDYPMDKIDVFVAAHNCTDSTAKIVTEYSQKIKDTGYKLHLYEYNNKEEKTKGYALKYLFEQIEKDFKINSYEGYFIFDADNVIHSDYITRMNEAFDSGKKIVTSFRNSKNIYQNWISYSYAMHWVRTCLTENRGKSVLNQACRIQGTGFLFSNELVKNGWSYVTLTEDRAFCTDAVVQNYEISYCDAAVFYDEQPYKLKVALRQRLRWAKGHLQSTVENEPKLLKNMITPKKRFDITYDCFWLNFPYNIERFFRTTISYIMELIIAIIAVNFLGVLYGLLIAYAFSLLKFWLGNMFLVLLNYIIYEKRIHSNLNKKDRPWYKILFYAFMFPFFDKIGKWSMIFAMFVKVEWKPIPHDTVIDMDKLTSPVSI